MNIIKQTQFGKDHWSLLGYIESRINSHQVAPFTGALDKNNLRINPNGDYAIIATDFNLLHKRKWKDSFGTRLKGYWKDKKIDATQQISAHDDVNCMNDLEAEKLIEVISLVNFYVKLTKKGQMISSQLRAWKNGGNNFATFNPTT